MDRTMGGSLTCIRPWEAASLGSDHGRQPHLDQTLGGRLPLIGPREGALLGSVQGDSLTRIGRWEATSLRSDLRRQPYLYQSLGSSQLGSVFGRQSLLGSVLGRQQPLSQLMVHNYKNRIRGPSKTVITIIWFRIYNFPGFSTDL